MKQHFSSIPDAIQDIKQGKMLIVLDDPARENEGDFFIPAEIIKPKDMLTMIRYGGGLVCTAITPEQAQRLALPLMRKPQDNTEKTKVNFTYSVNAKKGISTGVSAFDRVKTIKILANKKSKPTDIVMPGHVHGLVAKQQGLRERTGHTEAAVDLSELAGFAPAGVLCEIVGNSGKMAKQKELILLAKTLGIKIITIADLITYLKAHPLPQRKQTATVVKTATATLPTAQGVFTIHIYRSVLDNLEHAVLTMGERKKQPVLTRIHSQCLTGDTFFSLKCDCGEQLEKSMEIIAKEKAGVIMYLHQEGRGIGLSQKIKAYALQEKGLDTVEANHALGLPTDARDYQIAAEILRDLGIEEIVLLTNNPDKLTQLKKNKIVVVGRKSLETIPHNTNRKYLTVKKQKLGHHLQHV